MVNASARSAFTKSSSEQSEANQAHDSAETEVLKSFPGCKAECQRVYATQRGSLRISSGSEPDGAREEEMKRAMPFFLTIALCFCMSQDGSAKTQGDSGASKIIAMENLWNQMQLNHDAEAMGKLLDEDFVLTDYDGAVIGKAAFLDSIRDPGVKLSMEVSSDMKLHEHGETVVVTGATQEKGMEKGRPFEHKGRFTDTWIKKNGQWLCVASQLGIIAK